jgi:hypothetical protein
VVGWWSATGTGLKSIGIGIGKILLPGSWQLAVASWRGGAGARTRNAQCGLKSNAQHAQCAMRNAQCAMLFDSSLITNKKPPASQQPGGGRHAIQRRDIPCHAPSLAGEQGGGMSDECGAFSAWVRGLSKVPTAITAHRSLPPPRATDTSLSSVD